VPPECDVRVLPAGPDLDAAIALRFEVFVDEQHVPPDEELDAHDASAVHFGAFADGALVGVARVVDAGGGVAKVGRVAVRRARRGGGVGRLLMERVVAWCRDAGFREVILDAQCRVEAFYARLGFVSEGDVFLDAGIDHVRMRRVMA